MYQTYGGQTYLNQLATEAYFSEYLKNSAVASPGIECGEGEAISVRHSGSNNGLRNCTTPKGQHQKPWKALEWTTAQSEQLGNVSGVRSLVLVVWEV